MKTAHLIYNPTSGKELVVQHLDEMVAVIEEAGFTVTPIETTPEEKSAMKLARQAAEQEIDLVIAAGGDGTLNEVVNGIADLEKRPVLGIIPGGTTNDYARALNIPCDDLVEAARVIAKQNVVPMDIGACNGRYFINIAAGGNMTDLTYEVPAELKTKFGYFAYVAKGIEKMFGMEPLPMKITYDGGEISGDMGMFFIGLTNSIGGFEQIIPDSYMTDGMFSLLVVKTTNLFDIIGLLNRMVLQDGDHINDDNILYVKSNYVKVEPLGEQKIMVNLDGEYGGDAPAEFKNYQQHIQMCVNIDNMKVAKLQEERFEVDTQEIDA